MLKLAANVSLLYTEHDLSRRAEAAAADGFCGVEILFPQDRPPEHLRDELAAAGLPLVLMNAPQPTEDPVQRGFPAEPGQAARFREVMLRTLDFASVAGPGLIHVMPGYAQGDAAEAAFVEALDWLCQAAPEQEFTIEPLNPVAQPGYLLNDYDQAARILDTVNRPNLGLQYDSYHAQMCHGDALTVWQRHKARARHVQLGQAPNRSAPGPGPVDFAAFSAALRDADYSGWISAEYTPSGADTSAELGWMALFDHP